MKDLRENFLPIGAVLALVIGAITMAWTGSKWETALNENTAAIKKLAEQLGETWTRTEHDRWADTLHALNPDLKMPPPWGAPTKKE